MIILMQTMSQQNSRQEQIIGLIQCKVINDKYRVGPCIASGSYGMVFFASNAHSEPLAIKVVDMSIIDRITDPDVRQKLTRRLEQEDEAMRACDNPYVMKCLDCLIDEEHRLKFIVMEYCSFGSLKDLVFNRGCIPEIEARMILKQILYGLADFHMKGRLHRDVKLQNICGVVNRFILGDFGSASVLLSREEQESQDWRQTVNKKGTNVGSPFSKAPEMLGSKEYGVRVDLYGIGVMYYEMLTGVPPFLISDSASESDILAHIHQNISKIFHPSYIGKNLEKYGNKKGKTCLSLQASNFLKKLIVIDPAERAGWKTLLDDPYLNKKVAVKAFELAECVLPLKNIDWSKVKGYLESGMKKVYENKKCDEIDYECPDTSYDVKIAPVVKYERLSPELKASLIETENKSISQMEDIVNDVKKVHFQLRRIQLLLQVLQELDSVNKLKCDKTLRLVSNFCAIKAQWVEQKIKEHGNSFLSNYESGSLIEYIKAIDYFSRKDFEEVQNSILFFVKDALIYSEEKKELYDFLVKGRKESRESMSIILKYIKPECRKVRNQLREQEISKNTRIFLKNSQQILRCSFGAEDLYQWKEWNSMSSLLQQSAATSAISEE